MANAQFALTSKLHAKNICSGLSNLQQNGELVDMTLAADGHLVKVHQVILALASPYIKDLISSAQCQHPVIFLNKISYTTLSAMLEYIYTGEVLVTIHNLRELVEVGKELHIKGLEDMEHISHDNGDLYEKLQCKTQSMSEATTKSIDSDLFLELSNNQDEHQAEETVYDDRCISECQNTEVLDRHVEPYYEDTMEDESGDLMDCIKEQNALQSDWGYTTALPIILPPASSLNAVLSSGLSDNDPSVITGQRDHNVTENLQLVGVSKVKLGTASSKNSDGSTLQYTVSNQGSLQMILNRYMYYLKYTNRNRSRQWRCVDYLKSARCPAHVITNGDVVVQRIAAHTHPFHDQRILKKVRAGAIFSAILEAEREGENIMRSRGISESGIQSE